MSISLSKTGIFLNYEFWTLSFLQTFWNNEKRYVDAFLKLNIFRKLKTTLAPVIKIHVRLVFFELSREMQAYKASDC